MAHSEDEGVLSPGAWSRVVAAWAEQVGVPPATMRTAGIHAVQREDLPALVAVRIRAATVVVAPFPALSAIAGLPADELLSTTRLMERLVRCDPEPIGTASIAFRDGGFGGAPRDGIQAADGAAVEELRDAVSDAEWHEGGLEDMPDRWAAITDSGQVAAIAGYERWGEGVAQVGVVSHPALRGRGFARLVSAVAVSEAHDAGLVPQWRSRLGNEPSQRLGASLGFAVLGQQAAVALGTPHP
ncbi:MAG: GNAT family N-acetyltransferase [Demequina sp.]|nr:GNAT family N-acetyltransferase [Demequina sp.]